MRNPEYRRKLVNYFKKNLKKGYTTDALKWALINQGYSRSLVEESLELANKELAQAAPVIKEKPKITYQLYDIDNKPILVKKSWWKRIFRK